MRKSVRFFLRGRLFWRPSPSHRGAHRGRAATRRGRGTGSPRGSWPSPRAPGRARAPASCRAHAMSKKVKLVVEMLVRSPDPTGHLRARSPWPAPRCALDLRSGPKCALDHRCRPRRPAHQRWGRQNFRTDACVSVVFLDGVSLIDSVLGHCSNLPLFSRPALCSSPPGRWTCRRRWRSVLTVSWPRSTPCLSR